jgi:L-serine dehydratase
MMMRFKDVFSIIGPAMVGPSSSHTAGSVRLGRTARKLMGELPHRADIIFYGSFAETYQGHGTDLAIIGGLLDYDTDDLRIPLSIVNAERLGMEINFKKGKGQSWHPNTAKISLETDKQELTVIGSSIGGGNIEISNINGFDVQFTSMYPTLVIVHDDRPGMIADVTHIFRREEINIGHMDVDRKGRSKEAMTVIEIDGPISEEIIHEIEAMSCVHKVNKVDLTERGIT